ncbi:MAG: HAD-IIB family hydrolase, partial [Selenomonadaceae bacterium]|nr:HAD-IIB family hydrolase [Selenomonadaceae bacterium]
PLKFAASDFDGTLYRDKKISADDLAAIKSWRAAGNVFGIVTGRAFTMLTPHLKEFNLDLDFAICDNGAIIFGGDAQIIFESELPKKILLDIMNDPFAAKSFHFLFEAADKIFFTCVKEPSWVLSEGARWNLIPVDAAQIESLPKINQLALGFPSAEDAQVAADALNKKFGGKILAHRNTHSLDIVPAGISKAQGIEKILELRNWNGAEVFVIGDEANDLPMIKKFGGYTVTTAKDFVKREARAVFDSVGAMLTSE